MHGRAVSSGLMVCVFLLLPHAAFAQSAIAGVVKDATGAVLPGVTAEATSPALIEKVKSVTTNEQGQYRIVDLRPGTYPVTFTLGGFATTVREEIVLESNFTAPINVELKVGNVEQSITVTGESPIVDVQTSQRRQIVSQQLMDVLPTGRSAGLMAGTLPGVFTGAFDVGGSTNSGPVAPRPARIADQRLEGVDRWNRGRWNGANRPVSVPDRQRKSDAGNLGPDGAADPPRTSCRGCSSTGSRKPAATPSRATRRCCSRTAACKARTSTMNCSRGASRLPAMLQRESRHQLQPGRSIGQGQAVVLCVRPELVL